MRVRTFLRLQIMKKEEYQQYIEAKAEFEKEYQEASQNKNAV